MLSCTFLRGYIQLSVGYLVGAAKKRGQTCSLHSHLLGARALFVVPDLSGFSRPLKAGDLYWRQAHGKRKGA